jgi:hypothetical protein
MVLAKANGGAPCSVQMIAAVIIGIISTVADGMFLFLLLHRLQACANKNGKVWSPSVGYSALALQCHAQQPTRDLSCIDQSGKECYYFNGHLDSGYFLYNYKMLVILAFISDVLLLGILLWFMCLHVGTLFEMKINDLANARNYPFIALPNNENNNPPQAVDGQNGNEIRDVLAVAVEVELNKKIIEFRNFLSM